MVPGTPEVASHRYDERVQLCKEGNGPHDVHGGRGKDEGRSPDTAVLSAHIPFLSVLPLPPENTYGSFYNSFHACKLW